MLDYKRYSQLADRMLYDGSPVARVALALAARRKVQVCRVTGYADAFTRATYARRRRDIIRVADRILDRASECSQLHSALCQEYDRQYGDHGPVISGIHRDHYPAPVKDRLRRLARSASASGFAWELYRVACRPLASYRKAHDARAFGYYG